ncbi:MAG TPA: hypothetical protein VIK82_09840, partial [Porticoccaceae bacterium]
CHGEDCPGSHGTTDLAHFDSASRFDAELVAEVLEASSCEKNTVVVAFAGFEEQKVQDRSTKAV